MKTKDSISKKKQKLRNEALFWDARAAVIQAGPTFNEAERIDRRTRAIFCRQEAAKRREALDRLQTRTRWQVINGWK